MFTQNVYIVVTASAKKPQVKRRFVTTHQLQQQQQKRSKTSPEVGKKKEFSAQPVLMSGQEDVHVNENATVRRKLDLDKGSSDSEKTKENDVPVKV